MNDNLKTDGTFQMANFATGIGQIIIGISGAIIGILRMIKAVKEWRSLSKQKLNDI